MFVRNPADIPKDRLPLVREVKLVDAAIIGGIQPLNKSPLLQLVDDSNEGARVHMQGGSQVLLTDTT